MFKLLGTCIACQLDCEFKDSRKRLHLLKSSLSGITSFFFIRFIRLRLSAKTYYLQLTRAQNEPFN